MKKSMICLGWFVMGSAIPPLTASAAPITALATYTEARSFARRGESQAEATHDRKTQAEVGGAKAEVGETRVSLTDPTAGYFTLAMAAELAFEAESDYAEYAEATASGVARYAFSLTRPATLALSRTLSETYVIVRTPYEVRAFGLTATLNGAEVFLESAIDAPRDSVTLSLLPGVYTLEAVAEVALVNLVGPAAAQAFGTGLLNFEITSTALPEPATWTLIVAAVTAFGARRFHARSGGY